MILYVCDDCGLAEATRAGDVYFETDSGRGFVLATTRVPGGPDAWRLLPQIGDDPVGRLACQPCYRAREEAERARPGPGSAAEHDQLDCPNLDADADGPHPCGRCRRGEP